MNEEKKESPTFSPHAGSLAGMALSDFPEAMRQVINGQKITKTEWGDNEYYGCLHEGRLKLHKPDGIFYPWILSEGDLVGTDWLVLK
jgi:hypothetical protein